MFSYIYSYNGYSNSSLTYSTIARKNFMSKNNRSRGKRIIVQTAPNLETENFDEMSDGTLFKNINRKLRVSFRNESQRKFWELIDSNEIILCVGPAGTGKSYLSVAKALKLLTDESNKYKRILVVKPVVEADEKLGALPGTVEEKLEPYSYSTKLIIEKIVGRRRAEKLLERKIVEFTALAYLRGVNIDNTVLVFEEGQNSTKRQMKTLLTRIGENCKFICSGDLEQSDRYKDQKDSGLFLAIDKLNKIDGIATFQFKPEDIVRNPLIGKILERLNGDV